MELEEAKRKLYEEGFERAYVQDDPPGMDRPAHAHDAKTVLIVLDGGMKINMQEKTNTLKPGYRFDVPAHEIHSAKIGPKGCRYLVGK
ncbi:MAG TPA: cupin domain-containing protein [Candidatus Paceibacterota bacterium]|nr:cupin domain-containing protein [Candidatus Paceibacterota bacterium]